MQYLQYAIGSTDPVIWNTVALTPLDPALQKVGGQPTPLTPWFQRHCLIHINCVNVGIETTNHFHTGVHCITSLKARCYYIDHISHCFALLFSRSLSSFIENILLLKLMNTLSIIFEFTQNCSFSESLTHFCMIFYRNFSRNLASHIWDANGLNKKYNLDTFFIK